MLTLTVVTVFQFAQLINSILDLISSRFLCVSNESFDILSQIQTQAVVTHYAYFVVGAVAKSNGLKVPDKPQKS